MAGVTDRNVPAASDELREIAVIISPLTSTLNPVIRYHINKFWIGCRVFQPLTRSPGHEIYVSGGNTSYNTLSHELGSGNNQCPIWLW